MWWIDEYYRDINASINTVYTVQYHQGLGVLLGYTNSRNGDIFIRRDLREKKKNKAQTEIQKNHNKKLHVIESRMISYWISSDDRIATAAAQGE